MRHRESNRAQAEHRKQASKELVRKIGSMEPYADADAAEVEERLRNMNYGATHPRVSELRRTGLESDEAGEDLPTQVED